MIFSCVRILWLAKRGAVRSQNLKLITILIVFFVYCTFVSAAIDVWALEKIWVYIIE